LRPLLVFSKGGGGGKASSESNYSGRFRSNSGSSRSPSTWVFWYGGDNRTCGNYCILTFSIVAFIILAIILFGIWKCIIIRKYYKNNEKFRESTDLESEITKSTEDNIRTQTEMQYPPLPGTAPVIIAPPPAYTSISPAPEKSYLHGLRHEATYKAYKAGKQFTRENPPHEILPPQEHVEYILSSGPKAWEMMVPKERAVPPNIIDVSNKGRVISFHGKNDVMIQANYPHFLPQFNDNSSVQPSPISITSMTELIINSQSEQKYRENSLLSDGHQLSLGQTADLWFFYFEVTVLSNPNVKDTTIAVGLTTKPYPNFRLPGWNDHSVGYHSDDGNKFHNDGLGGQSYAKTWGEVGDTIGCGYYPKNGTVFFTKNGKSQGNAFTGLKHIWFPTVGADGECKVEVNFGDGDREFRYKEARITSAAGPISTYSNTPLKTSNY
ncbi:16837_t:CDS:2, partial [Cetraspora pellucida]